ncbi:MAG: hypothetical protein DRP89_01725 [Candidatus Neomarinimicrobiota bacterium]|nr:MAG: hypothetical protein DRP89_01725 [Candidatus Neomarinimicrobiota bacterium]
MVISGEYGRAQMTKIFITGASGFLGGHLTKLSAEKYNTVGAYHSYKFDIPNVKSVYSDLSKPKLLVELFNSYKPDIIIHNAAYPNPDKCEENPDLAFKINTESTGAIAKWAERNNRRLIFISTDMVFDGRKGNYSEEDPVGPLSTYAKTKVEAEKLVLDKCKNAVVCRIALMYGRGVFPRQYGSEWLERVLKEKYSSKIEEPILLFSDQYRSMISVNNSARAIMEVALTDYCGILHLGGSERINRYEFGEKLCDALGLPQSLIRETKYDDLTFRRLIQKNPAGKAFGRLGRNTPRPKDVSLNISRASSFLKTKLLNVDDGLEEIYPSEGLEPSEG